MDGRTPLEKFSAFIKPLQRPGALTAREASAVQLALVELLTDGVDPDMLKFAARFLTPEDYEEIVLERNILHLCGYPLCNRDPKGVKKAHQINYRPTAMPLPLQFLSQYCTKEHYQSSKFYSAQLSEQPLFSRIDVTYYPYGSMEYELQTVLLEEVEHISETQNRSMKSIIEDFKALSVSGEHQPNSPREPADPKLVALTNELKSITLRERSGERIDAYDDGEMSNDPNVIEGYKAQR
ncbi:RNA polymerase II subunit B1 CTD phosphatase Rtr1p [Trichomonascus vanleenenianus]|uniref:Rtr1/RPAP2 family protein phosphatase n=1 Tax=Trichomonascus vanleenenianus TaxID=2268995 RepID=UPI003EC99700